MRKAFWLLLFGLGAWLVVRRFRALEGPTATVGYEDGSSIVLEPGAPELERLELAARDALRA